MSDPLPDVEAQALRAVAEAASLAGLDAGGARVMRCAATVMIELPIERLVARVTPTSAGPSAAREVVVARALAAAGVPAVRPAEAALQPVETAFGIVTLWHLVEHDPGRQATPGELGTLCRRLHRATSSSAGGTTGVAPLDPWRAIGAKLALAEDAGTVGARDLVTLRRAGDELAERWEPLCLADPLGTALVHGDLHRDNVIVSADGPVLADLELCGWGAPCYDLVPQVVAVRRYGAPDAEYQVFAHAYGFDVRRWSGCELFCRVYELWVTAWTLAAVSSVPSLVAECDARLALWRGTTPVPRWTLR